MYQWGEHQEGQQTNAGLPCRVWTLENLKQRLALIEAQRKDLAFKLKRTKQEYDDTEIECVELNAKIKQLENTETSCNL